MWCYYHLDKVRVNTLQVKVKGKKLSLRSSQMAHQAGAYPGFGSMKRLGVFLLPHGWDVCPSQGYTQQ